jgi:hypothetical protein
VRAAAVSLGEGAVTFATRRRSRRRRSFVAIVDAITYKGPAWRETLIKHFPGTVSVRLVAGIDRIDLPLIDELEVDV